MTRRIAHPYTNKRDILLQQERIFDQGLGGYGGFAYEEGDGVDGYVGDKHHTSHCEMWMVQGQKEMEELGVYMKYVGCPREGQEGVTSKVRHHRARQRAR